MLAQILEIKMVLHRCFIRRHISHGEKGLRSNKSLENMKDDLGACIKKNLVNINDFPKQKIQCKEHINGKALWLVKIIDEKAQGALCKRMKNENKRQRQDEEIQDTIFRI